MQRIVIVGASLAGIRAAEELRRRGFDKAITVIDGDARMPYDRPPLSKRFLIGELEPPDIALRRPGVVEALDLDLHLGVRATGLDVGGRRLHLDAAAAPIEFDGLILALGSVARQVPHWSALEGVFTLRTLGDALALRAALVERPGRVVIVGAGFIGLEVASSCRTMGLDVTVVEPLEAPVVRGLGVEMGHVVGERHRAAGVDLRLGVGVEALRGDRRVESVELTDGTVVEAGVVLVGIGAAPDTSWLEGSGLQLGDGIICDESLCAGPPGVYAAGDCARWPHPLLGEQIRIEHWTNATEHGALAAANLLTTAAGGSATASAEVPFVWSDQLGGRIQYLGRARPGDDVEVVHGDPSSGSFVALYGRGDEFHAAVGWSAPRLVMPLKPLLARRAARSEAREQILQQSTHQ